MATFTMSLKKAIEITGGTLSERKGITVLTNGNIGLEHYEIFDENYRATLNGKIIDHYWNSEIGLETIEMFRLAVRRRMNEIMPYYNELYRTKLLEFDPLSTLNIKSTSEAEIERLSKMLADNKASSDASTTQSSTGASNTTSEDDSESHSTSESSNGSRAINSDMPMTILSNDEDYASSGADVTSAAKAKADANDKKTGKTNSAEESDSNSKELAHSDSNTQVDNTGSENESRNALSLGYTQSPSILLQQFRAAIVNIDPMVIDDLKDCFMLVSNNQDNYTDGRYYGYY